jgi:hypothetical protein
MERPLLLDRDRKLTVSLVQHCLWWSTPQRRTFRHHMDCAHGLTIADAPMTDSPFSRTEAIHLIQSLLVNEIESKRRVLICFDFAYGYPIDFAAALQAATGKSDCDLPWLLAWQYLSEHIKDDERTAPGAKPSNRSNRFEVANQINAPV